MPWKVSPVSELRLAFVHQVLTLGRQIGPTCQLYGISRKTGYKWLKRYAAGVPGTLEDRSRRPRVSPEKTSAEIEEKVLEVRRTYGWGARKIRAFLQDQNVTMPSIRTVNNVLKRRGEITVSPEPPTVVQFFERESPHQLWQCDFKGPLEIGRRKVYPFTVLDDHSRYLLVLQACQSVSLAPAFELLWEAFGEFGLPESILCDNAFGTTFEVPKTVSWFEARLIRLGIRPVHGRPYHPQTQGKVERLHGTLEREVWPHIRRDTLEHFEEDVGRWRKEVYNTRRPHESLGDKPPISRFGPSSRLRPACLPAVEYEVGTEVRKVSTSGDVRWRRYRLLAGRGLVGENVRIEERDGEIALYYRWKEIRRIPTAALVRDRML